MLPNTLKRCKEQGYQDIDIIAWFDECVIAVGELFGNKAYDNSNKYLVDGYTHFDRLFEDYSEKQVRQTVWKYLKKDSQSKEGTYAEIGGYFVAVDCVADYKIMQDSDEFDIFDLNKWKRIALKRGHIGDEYDLNYELRF